MRHPTPQTELEWREPEAMRWADLPPSVRERVREPLGRLLRRVARPRASSEEAPDEAE